MVPMEAGLHGVGTGEMEQEVKREKIFIVTTREMLKIVMALARLQYVGLFVYLTLAYQVSITSLSSHN